ncbi:MAG: lipid-A-disaccharide synthase, partial [Paludibacteraceae bacterium]|nr:lipid-A-disaccharide synthase [Paludibacteraceae bacterium]
SGTATLETAMLGCPQVAVYHLAAARLLGAIRWAQPLLFQIRYFTLVNILSGRETIRELVANDFTADKVAEELQRLLNDQAYTKNMLADYEHIQSILGTQASAKTAAERITHLITSRQ